MRLDDGWKHLRLVTNVDGRKIGTGRYRDRTPRTASYGPGNHGSENSVDRVGAHCFYELGLDIFHSNYPEIQTSETDAGAVVSIAPQHDNILR